MSLNEIGQICSLFKVMDIDDNKIVKHTGQDDNLKYIIVLLRNSKVLLYIYKVFTTN